MTTQELDLHNISFGDLLDEYDFDMPERGQILNAVVIEADERELLLDVGLKRDAIVTYRDLSYLDAALIKTLIPGTETQAYVLQPYSIDGELIVSINKALELEDWTAAKELMDKDDTVNVVTVGVNRGGALVQFGRIQGFIPNSHLVTNKHEVEGQELLVKVIEIERQRNRLVFSEREAKFEEKQARMKEMNAGDIVTGTVVHITHFGAFIDMNGADGLIHISNIVHQHIDHPSDILELGQEIEVLIESIDMERERISLNRKALLPDPWETFNAKHGVGDLMTGRVTNVVDYGIFVAADGGMEGLVHNSKMQTLNLSHPSDMFKPGDDVLIRILDIDIDRRRIQMDIDSVTFDEQTAWMDERREREEAESEASDSTENDTTELESTEVDMTELDSEVDMTELEST